MSVGTGARVSALASCLFIGACMAGEDTASKIDLGSGSGSGGDLDRGSGGSGGGSGININNTFQVRPLLTTGLADPWGLAALEEMFWLADFDAGKAVAVDSTGQLQIDQIPLTPGITGVAASALGQMQMEIANNCAPVKLIVASQTGVLWGLNPELSTTQAAVLVDRSKVGAQYTGVAIIQTTAHAGGKTQELVLAVDFHNARIDVFNEHFQLVQSPKFAIPNLPKGFAPFGIRTSDDKVFVTFAQRRAPDPSKGEVFDQQVPGPGHGMVAAFDLAGKRLWSTRAQALNVPWGMALGNFVLCARGALLVANHGTGGPGGPCTSNDCGANANQNGGTIAVLDPRTGKVVGQLLDVNKKPIVIEGLWGITFSDVQPDGLYFVAGPNNGNGIMGVIVPVQPVPPAPPPGP